jgi:esterase
MIRLLVLLGLLSGSNTVAAAPWTLPAGVKTLDVNGYPMAFLESGTGESVVLVHGGGTDYRTWRRQVESPPRGFRLIAVSLRHYYPERWDGKGDKFSVKQHAEDLATFIQALGIGPVYLVGHSRGGPVVVRTVQARPALVKKLVLMEGAFGALLEKPGSGEAPGLSAIAKATKARFDQGDIEGGLELWFDREGTPGAWARRSEEDRQRTRDNTWTLVGGGSDYPVTCADLAGLRMPVLLMQGEKTSRRRASIVEAAHKCLPSAERAIIANAGHGMHLMNSAGFEKALVQFLSR